MQRELREGARRPFNYWVRVAAAAGAALIFWSFAANSNEPQAEMGLRLFTDLHVMLLFLICAVVPAISADCIAREKRDGTLGLLFLTPLTAGGIVLGKGLIQAIRAFTLWLSILPVLAIPFLTGGIGWSETFAAASLELSTALLCLAAGLFASTVARERGPSLVLAFLLSAVFISLFSQVLLVVLTFALGGFAIFQGWEFGRALADGVLILTGNVVPMAVPAWNFLPPGLHHVWHWLLAIGPIVALLLFFRVVAFAARRIESSWQDKGPSLQREYWIKRYCTPLLRGRFKNKMTRALDRNPIAWLQQYSWKSRLEKWGLCLVFTLANCLMSFLYPDGVLPLQFVLFAAVAVISTFSGIGSFLNEKRSGALELLLVTPVSVNSIILGRVTGLWKQILPACLIVILTLGFESWRWARDANDWGQMTLALANVLCGLLLLPVLSTYFALRIRNLIVAAALAWISVLIANAFGNFLAATLHLYDHNPVPLLPAVSCIALSNLSIALLACFLLHHSLSRRIYSF